MTKGFTADLANHRMIFQNGARTVTTTDGTLVCLLPTVRTFSAQTLTFPDFNKDELYAWSTSRRLQPLSSPSKYQDGESCVSMITALPQEYTSAATLTAIPTGADFFVGWAKISRTTAPANTWMGRSLSVLPVQSQWMPINGSLSALMEAELGMARAMHIYISGSNLVLEAEQSVSVAAGGYTGNTDSNTGAQWSDALSYNDAIQLVYKTTQGIPIFVRQSKGYGYDSPHGSSILSRSTLMRRGSAGGNDADGIARSPCARSDTTDYTSVYSVDITGRFGRRS